MVRLTSIQRSPFPTPSGRSGEYDIAGGGGGGGSVGRGVKVEVGVDVSVGVLVGVAVSVGVAVGVKVGVGVKVAVAVGVRVSLTTSTWDTARGSVEENAFEMVGVPYQAKNRSCNRQ